MTSVKIVVAGSLESIKDEAESLRKSIEAQCNSKLDDKNIKDSEKRASKFLKLFQKHELYPRYKALVEKCKDKSVQASSKKPPFHTKEWHQKALKRWKKVVKQTTACKDFIKSNKEKIPEDRLTHTYGSIPMHDALIKHGKEEIEFHRRMISLFKDQEHDKKE